MSGNAKQRAHVRALKELVEAGRRAKEIEADCAAKLATAKTQYEEICARNDTIENANGALRIQIALLTNACEQDERAMKGAADRIRELESRVTPIERSNQELRATISKLEDTVAELRRQDVDSAKLRRRLQSKTEEIAALERQVHRLQVDLREERGREVVLVRGGAAT